LVYTFFAGLRGFQSRTEAVLTALALAKHSGEHSAAAAAAAAAAMSNAR
jgi:hypothetical protein